MKHYVQFYNIEKDTERHIEFDTFEAAWAYASKLKKVFLNRPNPAPVFIDVVPA